jgi:hypothetical protein
MIRKGTPHDLQAIIELGYRLCDRTHLAGIPRDRPAIAQTITDCMTSQFGCCLVADHGGKITGAIVGTAQQFWFSRRRQAIDLFFTAESPGDGLRLLKRFVDWGWSVPGVVEVAGAQSSGIEVERTAVLYARLGFRQVGGVFSLTQRPQVVLRRSA